MLCICYHRNRMGLLAIPENLFWIDYSRPINFWVKYKHIKQLLSSFMQFYSSEITQEDVHKNLQVLMHTEILVHACAWTHGPSACWIMGQLNWVIYGLFHALLLLVHSPHFLCTGLISLSQMHLKAELGSRTTVKDLA